MAILQANERERLQYEIFSEGVRWPVSGEEIFLTDLFSLAAASAGS
ncbi:hypothetical protein HCH73_06415 [Citrobacter koseri]|nr:hypothetical protein [Citrobacter koseri]MBI0676672.1 hypothetical protein [Citrobacter koseri]